VNPLQSEDRQQTLESGVHYNHLLGSTLPSSFAAREPKTTSLAHYSVFRDRRSSVRRGRKDYFSLLLPSRVGFATFGCAAASFRPPQRAAPSREWLSTIATQEGKWSPEIFQRNDSSHRNSCVISCDIFGRTKKWPNLGQTRSRSWPGCMTYKQTEFLMIPQRSTTPKIGTAARGRPFSAGHSSSGARSSCSRTFGCASVDGGNRRGGRRSRARAATWPQTRKTVIQRVGEMTRNSGHRRAKPSP
jgi:hypothetical protein